MIGATLGSDASPERSTSSAPNRIQRLTAEQAKEAKKIGRQEKAERMGVSASEVNLTPEEAKKAKAAFLDRLRSGKGESHHQNRKKSEKSNASPPPGKQTPSSDTKLPKGTASKEGSNSDGGSRKTFVTRLKDARRAAQHAMLSAIENPCNLHIVGYWNRFVKLEEAFEALKNVGHDMTHLADPFRGLVKIRDNDKLSEYFSKVVKVAGLQTQTDSPGIYILQSQEARSFWEKDRPSTTDCPAILQEPVPSWVDETFGAHSNKNKSS
jgi:hypothetical protein